MPHFTSFRTKFLVFVLGYIIWSALRKDIGSVVGMAAGGIIMIVLVEAVVVFLNKKERERQRAQTGTEKRL